MTPPVPPGPYCPSLAVLYSPPRTLNEALVPPFPRRSSRFGEGLLVCVLLRVHLLVEELLRQLVSVVDLQLQQQGNR